MKRIEYTPAELRARKNIKPTAKDLARSKARKRIEELELMRKLEREFYLAAY